MSLPDDRLLDLDIVICTFHREELLANALASVSAQSCPPGLQVRVVVVDNSDEGTAEQVVAIAGQNSPFEMIWIAAHPANISVARNAGVAAAQGTYLAFMDDDQTMVAGWLSAVATALHDFPYDAHFGAIESTFEAPGQATAMARKLFSRQLDAPRGHELVAMGPNKTSGLTLGTGNSVLRRSSMLLDGVPFDSAYGHGGGEDYDLFCRMQSRGCRFGWLPDARMVEIVPASRCNTGYLRHRFYAGGQAFAAVVANTKANPFVARWWLRGRALVQAGLLAVQLPLYLLRGRDAFIDYTYVWAGVLGKLSFGGISPHYRRPVKHQ